MVPEPEPDFVPEPAEFLEPAEPPVLPVPFAAAAFRAEAVAEAACWVPPLCGPDDFVPDPPGPQAVRARASRAVPVAARSVVRLRMVFTKDPPKVCAANAGSSGAPSLNC